MNFRNHLFLALVGALVIFGISGCGDSEEFVFTRPIADTNPQAPPQANPDAYPSVGNAPLSVPAAQGVFANDQLNEGGLASFDSTGSAGGTVEVREDGGFTYTPLFGFTGTDTFGYTISNSQGESSATVTITIQNLAFFVDNTAPDGGDGSFNSRFNTIAQATAAAGENDFIAVFRGDGTSDGLAGTIVLQDGQKLIGEGAGFTADSSLLQRAEEVRTQTIIPPGEPAVITGPVILADGNLVAGFQIDGSSGDGIFGEAINGATIENNEFLNYTESGVDFLNSSGTLQVLRCTFRQVAMQDGISLNSTNSSANVVINENVFTGGGAVEGVNCADIFLHDSLSTIDLTCNDNRVLFDTTGWVRGFLLQSNGTGTFSANGNVIEGDGFAGLIAATLEETGNLEIAMIDNTLFDAMEIRVNAFEGSQISGEVRGNRIDTRGRTAEGIDVFAARLVPGMPDTRVELDIVENTLTGSATGNLTYPPLGIGDIQCGINVAIQDGSICNARIEGNVISGFRHGLSYATIFNALSQVSIVNNNISGAEYNGILISVPNDAGLGLELLVEIDMNTVTGNGANGIEIAAGALATVEAAVRGNNAAGNTRGDIVLATVDTSAQLCAAITDNTSDELVVTRAAGSTFNVERLDMANGGPLEDVNTINNGTPTISGTPTAIMPGTCAGSLIN